MTDRLLALGGVARRSALVAATSRLEVDRALRSGEVVVLSRGWYALPVLDEARRAAGRLSGVICRLSAALEHGWEVRTVPPRPQLAFPAGRKLDRRRLVGVDPHRAGLAAGDLEGLVTSPTRTLVDCLRSLPFAESLTVADSALRHGFDRAALLHAAETARGPGSRRIRRVAALADGRAANPFESGLRALAVDVSGLDVEPQVAIGDEWRLGTPDLVDRRLGIVLEADSFGWHGDRAALRRDARRYDEFVVAGWLVLRFAYEDVMSDPAWVTRILQAAVHERSQRRRCPTCSA